MLKLDELKELVPAYVLDALDDADRAQFETHLAQTPELLAEVAAYQNAAGWLAYAPLQQEPSAEVRYRVLAATTSDSLRASRLTHVAGFFRAPAFAAVAMLLIVALGIWNFSLQDQLAQQAAAEQKMFAELKQQRDLMTVMAYSDAKPKRMWGTEVAAHAVGRMYGATDDNMIAMIVYDVPALPPNKVYQVWLIDELGDRTSGGTFTVDEQGRGMLVVRAPKAINQYRGVGVTIEPPGGSPKPTGVRVIAGDLKD